MQKVFTITLDFSVNWSMLPECWTGKPLIIWFGLENFITRPNAAVVLLMNCGNIYSNLLNKTLPEWLLWYKSNRSQHSGFFFVKRSFPPPQEPSTLVGKSALLFETDRYFMDRMDKNGPNWTMIFEKCRFKRAELFQHQIRRFCRNIGSVRNVGIGLMPSALRGTAEQQTPHEGKSSPQQIRRFFWKEMGVRWKDNARREIAGFYDRSGKFHAPAGEFMFHAGGNSSDLISIPVQFWI